MINKFDYYESFIDGSGEHKLTKKQINRLFIKDELNRMKGIEAEEIIKGNLKFWAEEHI
jgi:hypothetical protein